MTHGAGHPPRFSVLTDTLADTLAVEELLVGEAFEGIWEVIVHNDDVTTFETVITALVELFGHTRPAAETLAWTVHTHGRAQVAVGSEEFARAGVRSLGRRGIQASAEPLA